MRNPTVALLALLCPTLLLGGCANRDGFPSLARRPAEDAYGAARAAQPAAPAQPAITQGLETRLSALRNTANDAHARFLARQDAATRAANAARGAAPGSENWSVASIAVAGLESARAQAAMPLADLDRLESEASNRAALGDEADLEAINAARIEVESLVEAETKVIDSLLTRFAG
ncbi:hypothetical protein OVA07_08885 [Novosphingobium sp. SL115]|uniref:hypothetical protein n=1 Tax=Novosphingobium sp. SL115 TaxID=2995150 RepID=UPI002274C29A|nr:hypothetical protein [Novosphingobium sp. SL115]MCY1671126.1 hypothetical protein [Novosphingobium sp. SL115]